MMAPEPREPPLPLLSLCLALLLAPGLALAEAVRREQVVAALPKLEALVRGIVEAGGVPGLAMAIVHDDEVVYLRGFGLREMGKPQTVDPDTVFQIASLSKPVSSSVVAALVSEGAVQWESRVRDLDPAFALHDPYPTAQVTLRDLFAHRSGLPGTAGDDLEDIGYGRGDVLKRLRLVPPSSSFRAGYSYSNMGFTEGAVAAARLTGKPWETVCEEKIFRPLGMASTSARHADFLKRSNRAELHIKVDGAWQARIKRDADAQAPAGGVSSSARDLAQWMRLVLGNGVHDGKRLIAAEALDETHVPLTSRGGNPVTGAASFYGLGWNVEFGRHGLAWGHAGAFSTGARTLVTVYPESNLGIVVLSNAFPTGVPEGIADSFSDLVFDGKVEKDWVARWDKIFEGLFGPAVAAAKAAYAKPPVSPTPALDLAAYAGRYANAYVGDALVIKERDALKLTVGPAGARSYPLRHFDRDLFLYYPSPELPDVPSALHFVIGPDGKASGATMESLDDNGLGALRRVGD